jgi:hypothetical protein
MWTRANASGLGWDIALVTGALALTFAVHAPALDGVFARDDQLLLFDAVDLPLPEYLFRLHGEHLLVVHKLVMVALHELFGYQARPFYVLALTTHLINVALLYAALRQVVMPALAAFGAALWGAALLHQLSLSWFSIYGQMLAVTCLLWVLLEATRCGARSRPPTPGALIRWNLLELVAGASHGSGLVLALVAPFAAASCVGRGASRRTLLALLPGTLIAGAIYVLARSQAGAGEEAVAGGFLSAVAARHFLDLLAAGLGSLVLGAAALEKESLPTLRGVALALSLVIALCLGTATPALRRCAVGAALLAIASYAAVAVGRTPFAAALGVPRMALAPRYHYAALAGAAMLVSLSFASLWSWLGERRFAGASRVAPVLGASLLLAWLGAQAVPARRLSRTLDAAVSADASYALETTLAGIEKAIASEPPGGEVYIMNRDYDPTRFLMSVVRHPERFPGIAAVFALSYESDVVEGRRVRFVESRSGLLAKIRARPERRIAGLLVSREEASALGVPVRGVPLRRRQPVP